jgi:hypothetical protein
VMFICMRSFIIAQVVYVTVNCAYVTRMRVRCCGPSNNNNTVRENIKAYF